MKVQRRTYLLISAVTTVRRSVDQMVAAWHRFWFDPLDPLMLSLIRLLTGWMLFYNLMIWSLRLETFFGRNGVQPLETVKRLYESRYVFSFWLWIDDQYLWLVHISCMVVAALFCMGAATRVTSILAFLITISYSQRVPVANFGFDQILGMMCLYLALSPCGAAISVDRLIRKWWHDRKGVALVDVPARFASARMASRLIQLHLCAIYFWAGFSKLKGPTWWTGEAMWNVIANQEYQTIDLTWMAWTPWLPYLIAHITIVWEAFFIVLVWNRRLRPFVLVMGTAMHFGIGAFMGMWTFGLIMTFAYLSFADPEIWRTRFTRIHSGFTRRASAASNGGRTEPLETACASVMTTADLQPASIPTQAVSALTSELPSIPKHSPSVQNTAAKYNILVIAIDAQHRSALREHFRGYGFDCRAVDFGDRAMHLLERQKHSAIVINGSGYIQTDLLSLVSDILDDANIPVLVLLAGSQNSLTPHFNQMPTVESRSLPASLREIRSSLETLLARCRKPVTD